MTLYVFQVCDSYNGISTHCLAVKEKEKKTYLVVSKETFDSHGDSESHGSHICTFEFNGMKVSKHAVDETYFLL